MKNIYHYLSELELSYSRSVNRVLFLDYDGTLRSYKEHPELAAPTRELKSLLMGLASDSSNQLVIISGRERTNMEQWFGDLPLFLAAEHGAFHKSPNENWVTFFNESIEWKGKVYPTLMALVYQFDGSFIEEKHYSLTWHYRPVLKQVSIKDKSDIIAAINLLPSRDDFHLYDENCALEFRTKGIDKGKFARQYVLQEHNDFVLAIGDGATDEDLFEAIGEPHFTIKVGENRGSSARYFLEDQFKVLPLLNRFLLQSQRFQGKLK